MNCYQPAVVSLQGIHKIFSTKSGNVNALEEVSFTVGTGEFLCIVGPSGCGKTTLLKILAGLMELSGGRLEYNGRGSVGRGDTALVFQEHGLFPWLTILDNVAFGLEAQGIGKRERRQKAFAFLDQVGLTDFVHNFPHELSVGMRQRAAIIRAILVRPKLLLMDEPFSALDAQSKLILQEELLRIWEKHRQSIVYVTHDINEAVLLGDRILVMSGRPGRILKEVSVPLDRPRSLRDQRQVKVRELSWSIWKLIEGQVRQRLHIPS